MVKTLQNDGFRTALAIVGWIAFIFGLLIGEPILSVMFLAVARVLPLLGDHCPDACVPMSREREEHHARATTW